MLSRKAISSFILFVIAFPVIAQMTVADSLTFVSIQKSLLEVGLPVGRNDIETTTHHAMIIGVSCEEKLPAWVCHLLLPQAVIGTESRTNNFREDTTIHCVVGTAQDYSLTMMVNGKKQQRNLGFDRGHLAPSADFKWSKIAVSESFYYSNMTPQVPALNRGAWANLEDVIRTSVGQDTNSYYVITGPVLCEYSGVTGGPNTIPVPNYFYKVVVCLGKDPRGIAFIMPNEKCMRPIRSYMTTIDKVEELTGFNFFPLLENRLQEKIEANSNFDAWNF